MSWTFLEVAIIIIDIKLVGLDEYITHKLHTKIKKKLFIHFFYIKTANKRDSSKVVDGILETDHLKQKIQIILDSV